MKKHIVCLLALSLSGCLPIPSRQTDSPELDGIVARNGAPVPDVRVCVVAKRHQQPQCVMTHADGMFRLRAMTTNGYLHVVDESQTSYKVTLQVDENNQALGYQQNFTGREPPATSLKCDLSQPVLSTFGDGPATYCVTTAN